MRSNSGLFDTTTENTIIGAILHQPSLVLEDTMPLQAHDFNNKRNQIIFSAIYNMAYNGAERISPQDIDSYLLRYETQYNIYNAHNGIEALMTIAEGTEGMDHAVYKLNYKRLKKFSMLRDLSGLGFDTKTFHDPDSFLTKGGKTIKDFTIEDILAKYKKDLNLVEERYLDRNQKTTQNVAEGMRDLIERLKERPEIGEFISGDILNYILRGARQSRYYLYSAPSGAGKTRFMVGNACFLAMPFINSDGTVDLRENYTKVVYISTEQSADEIQTMVLSFISGIDEEKILLNTLNPQERQRLEKAIEISEMYQDNLQLEIMTNPSNGLVRSKIQYHILHNECTYVFYDYIMSTPSLLNEYRDLNIREDVALMMLSNTLKEIAVNHDVFVMSGSQINAKIDEVKARNVNVLRGSKAIADKADVGIIAARLNPDDYQSILHILNERKKAGHEMEPNMVLDVYKNRQGSKTAVRLYRFFDHSTCRAHDLFLTDLQYSLITDYKILQGAVEKLSILELLTRKGEEDNG